MKQQLQKLITHWSTRFSQNLYNNNNNNVNFPIVLQFQKWKYPFYNEKKYSQNLFSLPQQDLFTFALSIKFNILLLKMDFLIEWKKLVSQQIFHPVEFQYWRQSEEWQYGNKMRKIFSTKEFEKLFINSRKTVIRFLVHFFCSFFVTDFFTWCLVDEFLNLCPNLSQLNLLFSYILYHK